ncbi:hypothetical protein HPB50_010516 [Hyalomma asiaticum]|uniref:Uncharacterized protein n=1 Tax=Hyalomma asiaticum TaxID=266040 RepID=A0ACB7SUA7_HYAAI|nr:hypothetical protein HPB50_010516 [Hyalomma asiaticum]
MRPMDFMGDALLKDLLTTQLYGCVYPHGRGTITRARSNIECNRLFAFVVAQYGWQRLFRVCSSTLSDAIAGYVRSVIDRVSMRMRQINPGQIDAAHLNKTVAEAAFESESKSNAP